MPDKKIALLIPVYYNQQGLEKSILSIQGKDKELVDIVVVDDGSEPAVHLEKLKDYNIHLLRQSPNRGIEHALNMGLEYILGQGYEYTARLDSGDTIIAERFSKQQAFLDSNPDYGVVSCWVKMVTAEGELQFIWKPPVNDSDIRKYMHLNSCFSHPGAMIRNSVLKQAGMYSDKYKSAEDYELFFRMLKFSKGANLAEPLIDYEVMNPDAISFKRRYQQLRSRLRIQLKYFDVFCANSYIGIIRTLIILMMPYKTLHRIKSYLRRS